MKEKRTVIIKVCFTESEAKKVKQDAVNRGMKLSEYLRSLTKTKPNEHKEVIKVFKKLTNEINHIGVNVNQLAKSGNAGLLSVADRKNILRYMQALNYKVEELIELYGNQ